MLTSCSFHLFLAVQGGEGPVPVLPLLTPVPTGLADRDQGKVQQKSLEKSLMHFTDNRRVFFSLFWPWTNLVPERPGHWPWPA